MFVGLNVIGIRMTCERPRCEKRANICSKQKIENRSKNRKRKKRSVAPRRTRRMKGDRSRPFRKIGCVSQISGRSLIPKVMERRFKRISWSTESKAALTSNRARSVTSDLSIEGYEVYNNVLLW